MSIKIIDNKKVEMSEDEFALYKSICSSYDQAGYNGSDLFSGLFETDDNGIIVFLRPPSKKASTMEVFLFLVGLMTQQHLRINHLQIDDLANQIKTKLREMNERILKLENK